MSYFRRRKTGRSYAKGYQARRPREQDCLCKIKSKIDRKKTPVQMQMPHSTQTPVSMREASQ
jgi:hypothetical protein